MSSRSRVRTPYYERAEPIPNQLTAAKRALDVMHNKMRQTGFQQMAEKQNYLVRSHRVKPTAQRQAQARRAARIARWKFINDKVRRVLWARIRRGL